MDRRSLEKQNKCCPALATSRERTATWITYQQLSAPYYPPLQPLYVDDKQRHQQMTQQSPPVPQARNSSATYVPIDRQTLF